MNIAILCDPPRENRAYVCKIHLFILLYVSPLLLLYVLYCTVLLLLLYLLLYVSLLGFRNL